MSGPVPRSYPIISGSITMYPAYAVAIMVLSAGDLSDGEAVVSLNFNGSALRNPPLNRETFRHILNSLKEEHADFYSKVQSKSGEQQGKRILIFLQLGKMLRLGQSWLTKQSSMPFTDETLQETYDAIMEEACREEYDRLLRLL
ncbi:hypothetical protein MMC18_001849 [Xylographa bjoerkii]|nr:hypothetical protein [Xylographa bjoerkii]